ncbi:MAG: fluoride efflux transporter CrcB [Gammaproteobacteria bacterium]|nr:MAG: fluoride efflux transporter CrcB [Gammaproteobacteria bacterium]
MNQILLVAFGGALGSVSRFSFNSFIYRFIGRDFPWATLGVNIIGSFFIGFLSILILKKLSVSQDIQSFLIIGFLGAFTTFSGFSLESLNLFEQGQYLYLILNILMSVILCILACFAGLQLAIKVY